MSDLHLLVPINVEALAVGEDTSDEWVNLKPDFLGIYSSNKVLGSQLENPAFSPVTQLYKPGVHLHWALPDGLTHGTAKAEGDIPDFPLIPNRWLVVRFWDQSESDQPDLNSRAWIIESDSITDDEEANIWPLLDSEKLKQPSKNPEDYSVFIGKACELNEWQGESNAPRVEITAVGYGDPAFAAYYPACKGILGFHDHDFDGIREEAEFTYMVVGWYSNPSLDPLYKAIPDRKPDARIASLAEFLEKTRWIYPEFQTLQEKAEKAKDSNADVTGLANQIPTVILCHGFIEGVQWNKTVNGVPLNKPFHIAVADTAVDALAALFAKESGKKSDDDPLAKLLAIFQYDLMGELEKPGGDSIVDAKIHERSFRPLSRGIRWDLLQDDYSVYGSSSPVSSPPIPGDIRLLLEKLNALQREINCKKRDREFLQSEIYAAWYNKVLNAGQKDITEELSTKITKLRADVSAYTNEIEAFEKTSASQQNEIQEKLETFLPGWKLKQFDEPAFRQPNDPVVLLAGDAFQRASRHGEDGRFRDDGQLLCRLSGEEITGLKIKVPYMDQEVTFIPNDPAAPKESGKFDDYWRRPFAAVAKIPDDFHQDIFDLLREALLLTLDSRKAKHIIRKIYKKIDPGTNHTKDIDKLSACLLDPYLSQLWKNAGNSKFKDFQLRHKYEYGGTEWEAELVGQFPSPVMKNSWAGNPWLPLFLQWQVCWTPDSTDTQNALQKWELNPNLNDHDFVWKDGEPEDDKGQTTYTGTSILTPGVGLHLSERLRQYNLLHENEQLRTLQTAINSMNVLCQSLGGFTDQLLMRKSYLELRPLEPGRKDNDFGPTFSSDVYEAVKDIDWLSPMTEGTFSPLRAGRLKLEKLWIIDAFGQFLRLVDEDHGAGLKEIFFRRQCGSDNTVRFQPRLAQPTRLSMQWMPAEDKAYKDENFNPVCGWILPNFLDKSLMIYDAGGYALGALQVVQKKSWSKGAGGVHKEIESFHWIDIPGNKNIFFGASPKEIKNPLPGEANPHLRDFVMGLLPLSEGCGKRFSDLLNSMSEALSYSSAGDAARNPNLALLIGRPFALVQASLCLEVDGKLATSPDGLTGGIENLRFPLYLGDRRKWKDLRLGDDGLAGFYLNNKYDKFHPVVRPAEDSNNDSYNAYNDSPLQISIAKPLKLTLLMDPTRGICVTSGILPRTVFPFPYHDLLETMENKQVIFFSGPVLNPASNEGIRMPRPSDIYGQWSWTHHPEVMTWGEAAIGDVEQEQNVFPDPPPRIVEGWLKLVTAPLEVRAFTVIGENPVDKTGENEEPAGLPCFQVSADKKITLSWSVIGAEKIELWMKHKEESILLFQSQSHPLPAQYTIQVDGDALFTLFAFGRKEFSPDKKEPEPAIKSIKVIAILK